MAQTILTILVSLAVVLLGGVVLWLCRRSRRIAKLLEDPRPPFCYFIRPGWVTSAHDGDRHWVSADQLIRLYRLNPRDCRVLHPNDPSVESLLRHYSWVPVLGPDDGGTYTFEEPT